MAILQTAANGALTCVALANAAASACIRHKDLVSA